MKLAVFQKVPKVKTSSAFSTNIASVFAQSVYLYHYMMNINTKVGCRLVLPSDTSITASYRCMTSPPKNKIEYNEVDSFGSTFDAKLESPSSTDLEFSSNVLLSGLAAMAKYDTLRQKGYKYERLISKVKLF